MHIIVFQPVHKRCSYRRGGVPVCFPQFGQLGPMGQHGFARNSKFEVLEAENDWSVTLVITGLGLPECGTWVVIPCAG